MLLDALVGRIRSGCSAQRHDVAEMLLIFSCSCALCLLCEVALCALHVIVHTDHAQCWFSSCFLIMIAWLAV